MEKPDKVKRGEKKKLRTHRRQKFADMIIKKEMIENVLFKFKK